jgi:UDP-glucose 4-epimerase
MRAKKVLGWEPTRDLNEILRSAWVWEQKLQSVNYQL